MKTYKLIWKTRQLIWFLLAWPWLLLVYLLQQTLNIIVSLTEKWLIGLNFILEIVLIIQIIYQYISFIYVVFVVHNYYFIVKFLTYYLVFEIILNFFRLTILNFVDFILWTLLFLTLHFFKLIYYFILFLIFKILSLLKCVVLSFFKSKIFILESIFLKILFFGFLVMQLLSWRLFFLNLKGTYKIIKLYFI